MSTANLVDLKIFNPYRVSELQRVGNQRDGGYVIHMPSLQKVDALLNYGVGYNVVFEKEFYRLTGKPVYAFDPTMKKLKYFMAGFRRGEYVVTLKLMLKLLLWMTSESSLKKHGIQFIEEGLAATNTPDFKTINYHLSKYHLADKQLLLKIDIEGAEYEVMKEDSFYDTLGNVVQLVVEFHYLDKRLNEVAGIIERLAPTHSLVHIHGNNNGETFTYTGKNVPEVIEVVFLRNDFIPEKKLSQVNYPVTGLDNPCNWRKKDIVLDFFK